MGRIAALAVLALSALVVLSGCSKPAPSAPPVASTAPRVPAPAPPEPPPAVQPAPDAGTAPAVPARADSPTEMVWLPMACDSDLPLRPAEAGDPGPPSEALWAPYPDVAKAYTVDVPALRDPAGFGVTLPEGTRGWAWETADPPAKVREWARQHLNGWSLSQFPGNDGQVFDDIAPPWGPAHACFFVRRDSGLTCLLLMLFPESPENAAAPEDRAEPSRLSTAESARLTTCMSNVRQLSVGVLTYVQDYDEVFPGADWSTALRPYLRDTKLLLCPSDDRLPSYALRSPLRGKELLSVRTPPEDIMLYESDDDRTLIARHRGDAVLSYVDGHVKAMPKSNVPLQTGMR